MTQKIESIIISALQDINEDLENELLNEPTSSTKIFGGNGALASLALVSLIADLEGTVSDEFDIEIVLADERAMSQRTSPFRTVKSLAEYINMLINEKK